MEETTLPSVELPLYKCHKQVRAAKIVSIAYERPHGGAAFLGVELPCGVRAAVHVGARYVAKHEPVIGGYYIKYEDGYESFSPAAAFEAGYTLLDNCVPGT